MPLYAKVGKYTKLIVLIALLGACTPAPRCPDGTAVISGPGARPCIQGTREGNAPAENTNKQAAPQKDTPTARSVPLVTPNSPTPHYPSPVPSAPIPQRGVVDPRTGQYLPPVRGGVINPGTGEIYPDTGAGYVNPRTGQIIPKP